MPCDGRETTAAEYIDLRRTHMRDPALSTQIDDLGG
jgi:hypothetical protein